MLNSSILKYTSSTSGNLKIIILIVLFFNLACKKEKPQTYFEILPESTYINTTIQFNNKTISANRYIWDFGDGKKSRAFSPTHSYANTGEYEVVLTGRTGMSKSDFKRKVHVYKDLEDELSDTAALKIVGGSYILQGFNKQIYSSSNFILNGTYYPTEYTVEIWEFSAAILSQKMDLDRNLSDKEKLVFSFSEYISSPYYDRKASFVFYRNSHFAEYKSRTLTNGLTLENIFELSGYKNASQ